MNQYLLLLLFIAAFPPAGGRQAEPADRFPALDAYAQKAPASCEKDLNTLAAYLAKPAKNDLEKARIAFAWVATHIRYDSQGFGSGRFGDTDAEQVLRSKRSVCEGYSNLFEALGKAMGLEVATVSGYAKGVDYRPGMHFKTLNHSWNAVKIGDSWKLMDVTWGGGYVEYRNGRYVSVVNYDPFWFDVDPKAFVFTHFTEESAMLGAGVSLSKQQYEQLPLLDGAFFKLGFPPAKVYQAALSGSISDFVEIHDISFQARVIELPIEHQLHRGNRYTFSVVSENLEKMAIIDGKDWIPMPKKGNTFSISYVPKSSQLSVSGAVKSSDKTFWALASYVVAAR